MRSGVRDAFAWRLGRIAVLAYTLLAFLVSTVHVELHETAVVHVVCAEHGGSIEDVPAARAADAGDHASDVTTVRQAPSPEAHQSCTLPPGLLSGAVLTTSPLGLAHPVSLAWFEPQPPEGVPGRTGPPLLQIAPKLSPPRV